MVELTVSQLADVILSEVGLKLDMVKTIQSNIDLLADVILSEVGLKLKSYPLIKN